MKTAPQQKHRDLETLGFLCRWALLTMAAAVILASAWAGLAGAMSISYDLDRNMHLSDAVWRQGATRPSLIGFLDGPTPRFNIPLFLYQDHLKVLRFSWVNHRRNEVVTALPAPPAGTHPVTLHGLPYGPMAFKHFNATVRIVPGPETVYLLDARFFIDVVRNDQPTALRIAKEFSRLGQAVLLLPEQRELLAGLRTEFDQYSDMPHVFSLRKGRGHPSSVLAWIAGRLKSSDKTHKGDDRKAYVVTADAEFAIAAAEKGHYTHLVGAKAAPPNLPENIRLHANPKALADHLHNQRPPHLPYENPALTPIP